MRKIKYFYADARRFANPRGITLLGPKKIFDQTLRPSRLALCRQERPRPRPDRSRLSALLQARARLRGPRRGRWACLTDAGADAAGFDAFAAGDGSGGAEAPPGGGGDSRAYSPCRPSCVDGELFWVRTASTLCAPSSPADQARWPSGSECRGLQRLDGDVGAHFLDDRQVEQLADQEGLVARRRSGTTTSSR